MSEAVSFIDRFRGRTAQKDPGLYDQLRAVLMFRFCAYCTASLSCPKVAVQWLNQALCFYHNLCLDDSEVLRIRHLRVAANRYRSCY